jgi:hypothetical protein
MSGWVYGPGGGTTSPGGADKDIQFNNNGSFSGSALLTTDGSGSLSASVHVSASTYYGDGSNLTGITASAVNVADGPEYSIQFRRDAPVTGEISGSVNFRTNATRDNVFLTGTLRLSASAADGQDIFVGSGTSRTIGVLEAGGADFFLVGHDAGTITLSASSGIEFVANSTNGVGSFGSPVIVYSDQDGNNPQIHLSASGHISGSGNISGSNFYLTSGKSIFFNGNTETAKIANNGNNLDLNSPGNIILNADTGIHTSNPAAALHVSSSTANDTLLRVDVLDSTKDALLFVTSSGLVGINTSAPSNASSGDTVLDVNGHISVGRSATGIIFNNTDTNTFIKLGGTAVGDEMSFVCGAKTMLKLDENGTDAVTLGSAASDVIHASGSLTASVGMRVSASVANGQDIFVGSGTDRTIGVLVDGSDDFFVMGHDAGAVTLSASNGVEFVGNPSGPGVGVFGCPVAVYSDQGGTTSVIKLEKSGDISGSGNFTAKGQVTIGVSDEKAANFNIRDFRTMIVDTRAAVVTGTLPGVTSHAIVGLTYTIKDSGGNAATNNVVIAASGSQKIDGAAQAKIQANFGALTVTAFSSSLAGFNWGIVSAT